MIMKSELEQGILPKYQLPKGRDKGLKHQEDEKVPVRMMVVLLYLYYHLN